MTRAQRRSATRPPARRDPRRPAGAPAGARKQRTASPTEGTRPSAPTAAGPATTSPATTGPATADGTAPPVTGATPPRIPAGGRPLASCPSAGGRRPASAGARPLDNRPPSTARRPGRPSAPAGLPRVPAQGTRRTAVPQLRPTDHFAELLLAVLSGQRPVHAMLRHTAGQAYDDLARLAERGPLRTRGARPVVRDIGYYVPRQGALEVFARIGAGDRLRAMAFRLELGRDLRWRCTAVELGGPRPHRAATR